MFVSPLIYTYNPSLLHNFCALITVVPAGCHCLQDSSTTRGIRCVKSENHPPALKEQEPTLLELL